MPTKKRHLPLRHDPILDTAPSPLSVPTNPTDLSPRRNFENPLDYTTRLHATELLRPAQEQELAHLRTTHTKQIDELKRLLAQLSGPQRDKLLKKYADKASVALREAQESLEWARTWNWHLGSLMVMAVVVAWVLLMMMEKLGFSWEEEWRRAKLGLEPSFMTPEGRVGGGAWGAVVARERVGASAVSVWCSVM